MPVRRRRFGLRASARALAGKQRRERIIPPLGQAQTPMGHVNAVMLRVSVTIVAFGLPLFADPVVLPSRAASVCPLYNDRSRFCAAQPAVLSR